MAENSLEFIINAKDNASKVLNEVSKNAKSLGDQVQSVAKQAVIPLGVAFAGVTAVIGTSIAAFSESEEIVAKFRTALVNVGDVAKGETELALRGLATELQGVTKFSDETILSAETLFTTFGLGVDLTKRATKATLDLASAMGTDVQTSAQALGVALAEPAEGVGRLARSVPALKGALGDAIVEMAKSGDVAGAQTLLLKALEDQFGGTAKAAGKTFGGQVEILKNKINDLQEILGSQLVDALFRLTGGFENLQAGIDGVTEFITEHEDVTFAAAAALLVLAAALGIATIAAVLITAHITIIMGVVVALVAAVAFGATMIILHWQEVSQWFQTTTEQIGVSLGSALGKITAFLTTIPAIIMTFLLQAQVAWQTFWWVTLPETIGFAIGFILVKIGELVLFIGTALLGLNPVVNQIFMDLFFLVVGIVSNLLLWLEGQLTALPTNLQVWMASIPGIATAIWTKFWENTKKQIDAITGFIETEVGKWKAIIQGVLDLLGKVAEGVSKGFGAGFGSKQFGGFVDTTGLSLLHAGEFVLSKDMQQGRGPVPSGITNNFSQPITINATSQAEPDWDALSYRLAFIMRNSR